MPSHPSYTGNVKILAGQNTDLLTIRLPKIRLAWARSVKILQARNKPLRSKILASPKVKILARPGLTSISTLPVHMHTIVIEIHLK